MRIIAGTSRGRRLISPADKSIRPTGDRVKEAVFSMLTYEIPGSKVLDLFAGTGSLGLEALSRGAEFVTFVENSRKSLNVLKQNISITGFEGQCEVINDDALRALEGFEKAGRVFDLIFIDPPYMENLYQKVLFCIVKYGIIRKGGIIVVEHPAAMRADDFHIQLKQLKRKRYGNTAISIYTRGDDYENSSISRKL